MNTFYRISGQLAGMEGYAEKLSDAANSTITAARQNRACILLVDVVY